MSVGKKLPILLLLFLLASIPGYASHIYGGELLYRHETGNRYRVIVYLYGDCSGSRFPTLSYADANPEVRIYNAAGMYVALHLKQDSLNIDISPVCPSQRGNTTCAGGTLPGVHKFVYSDTVNLPPDHWRLIFAGEMGTTAGRSFNITNIYSSSSGTTIQLEANLNNSIGPNSSPRYTTLPTPFYCINLQSQYNQGASDDDGDSLSYKLVPAIDANGLAPLSSSNVSYIPPTSAAHPLLTAPGGFSFDGVTGQLSFVPNAVQVAVVVYQVLEYRAGQLIGTSMREMTFIVTDVCEASPAKMEIKNVSGGSAVNDNVIKICKGTPHLSFRIQLVNNGDNAVITPSGIPPTATVSISNNATANAAANFSWETASLPVGTYPFFLVVKDDHCPISTTQTLAYSLNVTERPDLSAKQLSPTECVHKAVMQFKIDNGYTPRALTVAEGGSQLCWHADSTGIVIDSFVAGNYQAMVICDASCSRSISFSITDSGKLPLGPILASYCVGDIPQPVKFDSAGPGAIITWYDADHKEIPGPPTAQTDTPATFNWFVQESYKVCGSDVVPVTAEVHALPQIGILSRPNSICFGDSLYLKGSGGIQYAWQPENLVHFNAMGDPYLLITNEVKFYVRGVDQYGCFNTDSAIIENIQQCCNFFYPTAFTPNGDGTNDGFKILTYGNMFDYRLEVFNRWGQRVYLSVDPHDQWDGTRGGVQCEIGTYFYRFNGRCLTGKMEEHQGDVTLIR